MIEKGKHSIFVGVGDCPPFLAEIRLQTAEVNDVVKEEQWAIVSFVFVPPLLRAQLGLLTGGMVGVFRGVMMVMGIAALRLHVETRGEIAGVTSWVALVVALVGMVTAQLRTHIHQAVEGCQDKVGVGFGHMDRRKGPTGGKGPLSVVRG